jgi:hypothetical protein
MSNECQICCEKLNLSTRKLVTCPYCEFGACKTCCETYVLGESNPKCMNTACNRDWTRQFIASAFTNVFITGKLKKQREQLLFDNERALLPATQALVERQINIDNANRRVREITEKLHQLKVERNQAQAELYRLYNRETPAERAEFVRACPDSECRGFLSTQWKCGICQKWACPDCHEVKGLERDVAHTCNPDTLATARLLATDTRPCPKCRMGIFKINGCDQIWCTQCHTAFNWRTGRIESNVHNPHYFEWLRRNGNAVPRNPLDNPCRNDLQHTDYTTIRTFLQTRHLTHPLSKSTDEYLGRTIRNVIHMRYVTVPRYRTEDRVHRNEQLRIQYMRNFITEDAFKTTLQRNEKKVEKYREIHNILTILLTTVTDIILRFRTYLSETTNNELSDTILKEINPIVDYVNECLRDTAKTYKSKVVQFNYEIMEV